MNPISCFFDTHDVEGHQSTLRNWRHYVVNDGFYNDERHGPGVLYHDYELNIRLIEALYLLYLGNQEIDYRRRKITSEQVTNEKSRWNWFPFELTEKELLDPFLILQAAFEEVKLQEFRDHLSEWLAAALSSHAVDETVSPGEIITIYDHLKKMYSAAWIIFKRNRDFCESEQSNGEIIDNSSIEVNEKIDLASSDKSVVQTTSAESSRWHFGLEETVDYIQRHNPSVEVIVPIHTNEDPYIHFLLITISDDEPMSNEEFAIKIEKHCQELVSVFAFVKRKKWVIAASKQSSNFLGYAYSWENLIAYRLDLEVPEPFNRTILPSTKIQEIWNDFGNAKERSFSAAREHFSLRDYTRCLTLVKQTVTDTLKGLIYIFTAYLPTTIDYERMFKMTLLFSNRLWNIFFNDIASSKKVLELLFKPVNQDSIESSELIVAEALNVLVLKVHVITLIADEEYLNLLRQAEEIEAAVNDEVKKN